MNKFSNKILLILSLFILGSCIVYEDFSFQSVESETIQVFSTKYYFEEAIIIESHTLDKEVDALNIEPPSEDIPQEAPLEELKELLIQEPEQIWSYIIPEKFKTDLLQCSLESNGHITEEIESNLNQVFPKIYTHMEGIITFRGNNLRNSPSYGISNIENKKLEKSWEFTTGRSTWGGGAGWTGQPVIVRWSKEIKNVMNIKDEFKTKEGFTEVIYGSLGGNVYFFDLDTGEKSRDPIVIKNPIKGSISIDPREYPLLYVGDGINETGRFGYRIFSLIDGKELYFIKGMNSFAHRGWGAFDSSGIINSNTDTLILGGENGLLYNVKLNTEFNMENQEININPEIIKYRYKIKGNLHQGIENSVATYKNLAFFGDNGGSIQCVDLTKMQPVWALEKSDDTDATITIEVEDDIPYLYTGTEVDKQGTRGNAIIRKINGLSGEIIWIKHYECQSILGEKPNNGGALATNIIGKNDLSEIVIFTLARYKTLNAGLIIALDKTTGDEIWRWEMPYYAWSSPVDIYNENGKGYIIQCDSIGNVHLLDGITGITLDKINLGANIESSPAVFENSMVIATRGGKIFKVQIQ